LPHATRSFSIPDPFRSASTGATPARPAPLQLGAQRVTSAPKRAQKGHLPPALAKALEPKIERTISLRIADFMDSVPTGYIKPVEILDAAVRVSLKASEIEKGMPEKKPTIALPSLYQQVPEIFLRGVRPDDDTRVALPYEKVLEQFSAAQVREDQVREPAVPQLDTPILKATLQDSERFGTKIDPIETSPLPSIPVKPATAETIAEAEPEALIQETKKTTTPSGYPVISLYSSELKAKSEPPAPKSPSRTGSIPFIEISPNGTGASASERVPASSGPPVPTPLPFSPELAKMTLPPQIEKARPAPAPLKLPSEPPAPKPLTPAPLTEKDETPITLSLKVVLQHLPAFQLNGNISDVSDDERLSLPLSLVNKQLATGRISIDSDTFTKALPEKRRDLFHADEIQTPVVLPLEEVLKNLPATVLKLRQDQEGLALDEDFETPFSIKAKEDAERFAATKAPEQKAPEKPAETTPVAAKIDIVPAEAPKPEEKIDPKKIVAEAVALAGVAACVITFADGLTLAGNLPEELAAGGLCAIAPSFLSRIDGHMRESKLGELVTMTVHSADHAISFFAKQNIYVAVLHGADSLAAETRKELVVLAEKLSAHYAKPE
jgi:predicted regulator of Ras-like GTPase activity (Roadblock/LC7/MglB family)